MNRQPKNIEHWLTQHRRMMQEHRRIERRNAWLDRNAWKIAVFMVLLGMAMGACSYPATLCADGTVPTEWCGCLPPAYGSDC